ncbi:Protein artemis [Lachnellula suecica]|uniref:Protein artemis n=1 Tax=Lachnellula suecica TaxID=602035 RepID=A0A8T9C1L3_9HELO|nr:Protein artemis [Lachnellula suecica]
MSTFGGVMAEFPDIRGPYSSPSYLSSLLTASVDYFRKIPGQRPPLKCFLSHVHSDHLAGLEDFKASFVYCSAATKELLIRLERSTNRINFENGVLESRKRTYRSLETRLKTIPLETPTRIELEPGNEIQVTLFDANHCTGAVMFLFEGDGKAVLYTGDIRSEPWFVNNLTRNPFLIEYTSGIKTLDCIYLDTSNTKPGHFPSKAEGLRELIQKVSKYPADTVFHFAAWTFGYEEVWMALSRTLKSKIHVDKYKLRLYQSLRGSTDKKDNTLPSGPFISHEGPVLTGYTCGNTPQEGCLTDDPTVRIHSCTKGVPCPAINEDIVWIRPIVTRAMNGDEVAEIGVGGGGQDLAQESELELDNESIAHILSEIDASEVLGRDDLKFRFLIGIQSLGRAFSTEHAADFLSGDNVSVLELIKAIENEVAEKQSLGTGGTFEEGVLSQVITFPYSRHSSYPELCDLVRIFKPKDVYQCTVNEQTWSEESSVRKLFGHECSAKIFRHDAEIREKRAKQAEKPSKPTDSSQQTQTTASSPPSQSQGLAVSRFTGGYNFNALSRRDTLSSSQPLPTRTPPRNITASSPGSASQGVRRKLILDELEEASPKRRKLRSLWFSDGASSPVPEKENVDPSLAPDSPTLVGEQSVVFTGADLMADKKQNLGIKKSREPSHGDTLSSLPEGIDREDVITLRAVYPHLTMHAARNALVASHGNFRKAVRLVGGEDVSDDSPPPSSVSEAPIKNNSIGVNTFTRHIELLLRGEDLQEEPEILGPLAEAVITEEATKVREELPHITMLAARNALIASHGNIQEAILLLGGENPSDEPEIPDQPEIPHEPEVPDDPDVPDEGEVPDPLSDISIKENIDRIRRTLPHVAMLAARNALISCHGQLYEAILLLGGEDLRDEMIDISDDDLEIAEPAEDTPNDSEADTDVEMVVTSQAAEQLLISAGYEHQNDDTESAPESEYGMDYDSSSVFYDLEDEVARCKDCGHEVWSLLSGCTRCSDEDPSAVIYDPKAGPTPGVWFLEQRGEPYLDEDSSAYDSQDEQDDKNFLEEYEVNSFIDDASQEDAESEHGSPNDEEVDWEARCRSLAAVTSGPEVLSAEV